MKWNENERKGSNQETHDIIRSFAELFTHYLLCIPNIICQLLKTKQYVPLFLIKYVHINIIFCFDSSVTNDRIKMLYNKKLYYINATELERMK
jgi:hypothetical protein